MSEELKDLLDVLRRENAAAHTETRRHFDAATEAVKTEFHVVAEAMKTEFHLTTEAVKTEFHVVAEAMKTEVQVVAEAVVQLGRRVEGENESIRAEMRQGFSDTRALIELSYAVLDRRVGALESSQGTK